MRFRDRDQRRLTHFPNGIHTLNRFHAICPQIHPIDRVVPHIRIQIPPIPSWIHTRKSSQRPQARPAQHVIAQSVGVAQVAGVFDGGLIDLAGVGVSWPKG